MRQIKEGLESGVDVSIYADPKFDSRQMWSIKLGLEGDLDVSIYADPKFDPLQMEQIRLGLVSRVTPPVHLIQLNTLNNLPTQLCKYLTKEPKTFLFI